MKPDSTQNSETKLHTYSASLHNEYVCLDTDSLSSPMVHIKDGRRVITERFSYATLICLEDVLRRWKAEQFPDNEAAKEGK